VEIVLGAGGMDKSRVALGGRHRGKSSGKAISHNLFGGLAAGCLALGCGWTIYTNIIAASVYPTLGGTGYDQPVARHSHVATRSATQIVKDAFAALPAPAATKALTETAPPITPSMFNARFAAAEPTGVASRAAEAPKFATASKPPDAPKLAEASKATVAPRTAEAQRPKHERTQLALNIAPPIRPPVESPARASGFSLRGMAERAKEALLSIGSHGSRDGMIAKLWGKQPSHSPMLAYASADADYTASIGHEQNPTNGGSPPYSLDTAVYDISDHTVYLPDGTRLEAHSGYGSDLDDPHSARVRMRGVTPPHIYELTPRGKLFHGVAALRLNPIGGDQTIYGRTGLLAHTYMLGPHGDSNGCVSFRDYNAFLDAYRNKGIRKLAVVARID
jgi:Tlde1 domain